MLKLLPVALGALLVAVIGTAGAETFTYPKNHPVFSVDFPENWITDETPHKKGMSGVSKTGDVYIAFEAYEDGPLPKGKDELRLVVQAIGKKATKDFELGAPDTFETNGITFNGFQGIGKSREGTEMNLSVYFSDTELPFILVYVTRADADDRYDSDLDHIFDSVHVPGKK